MKRRYVYIFGGSKTEGNAKMKMLLGGKGANLAEMALLGIPVPPGFTISTEVCRYYYENNFTYPKELEDEVKEALKLIEEMTGKRFGDPKNPLLVSVRSGAPRSMPGMMDTILNLGLNDDVVEGLVKLTGNPRFAYDSYRRFIMMYGDVVLKIDRTIFEKVLESIKHEIKVKFDHELPPEVLKTLIKEYKEIVERESKSRFPEDPYQQLWGAIGAVFKSWNNERAIVYRRMNNIPDTMGTAVNVQTMVFGNMGEDSATGVAFTRDPATGEKKFFGEWLPNAQGEDVVAGIRTPLPLDKEKGGENSLEAKFPELYRQLLDIKDKLETHYKDMQDIEFTIERGKLWMLQTRSGKRTGIAALRIAVEMVEEGLISEKEALLRIEPSTIEQLLKPLFDPEDKEKAKKEGKILAKGLNAGPGAASGKIVLSPQKAEEWSKRGEEVILVRYETSPDDIKGMKSASGILTARGGMTSHAAVVARQMGKVCIVGCEELVINYEQGILKVKDRILKEGDFISIDGTTGEVIEGKLKTISSPVITALFGKGDEQAKAKESIQYKLYSKVMEWADKYRKLGVRTNADLPEQAEIAIAFGAEGIGLCRTEHMFFGEGRITAMREMILAKNSEDRKKALSKLLPYQKEDFKGIFRVMGGRPVTIRTLDPPLHEFLPHDDNEIERVAKELGLNFEEVKVRVESLKEFNPMLGHRGCRLGITYPEITEMQARAIFEAAVEVKKEGVPVKPEIMIPLVGHWKELENQAEIVHRVAEEVFREKGERVEYLIGTMIELPRAAITGDQIARIAQFFSFGTNDLTQTTMGLSRDDAGTFLAEYYERGILSFNPFETLDIEGVGELIKIGVEKGRSVRPELKIGICGEHGGDPASIEFCHKVGLDYVSCSPFRVATARLAAARGALLKEET